MIERLRSSKLHALCIVLAGVALACGGAADDGIQDGEAVEPDPAPVSQEADVSCELTFTMAGWSAIVSMAEGQGVVTCDNGQRAEVDMRVTGGGLTVGKTEIDDGRGEFSDVRDISEVFGSYAQAEASAGTVDEAVSAQALTKGDVSLVITAEGRGWSLGVSGAKFTIERPGSTPSGSDAASAEAEAAKSGRDTDDGDVRW